MRMATKAELTQQVENLTAEVQRLIDGIVIPAEVFFKNPGAPGKVCQICGYSTAEDDPDAGHSSHCVLATPPPADDELRSQEHE